MDTTSVTQAILGYSLDELQHRVLEDIGTRLPIEFIATLSEIDTIDALRVFLIAHHGEEVFRPAYGQLGEFRAVLPLGIPFQALSATFPPHIRRVVQDELAMSPNHVSIALSTNRPNITYATTPIIGTLRNFRNLNCLVPPMHIPNFSRLQTRCYGHCTIYQFKTTKRASKPQNHQTLS